MKQITSKGSTKRMKCIFYFPSRKVCKMTKKRYAEADSHKCKCSKALHNYIQTEKLEKEKRMQEVRTPYKYQQKINKWFKQLQVAEPRTTETLQIMKIRRKATL